jgi:TolA-binding protein
MLMTLSFQTVKAQEQTVSYTFADRDRITRMESRIERMETKIDMQFNSIQQQFDNSQKQIDQLSSMFFWGFGILITLFVFNLGYTIWDRRTAIKPALDRAESADFKSTGILRLLRDYTQDHPDLANLLKLHGFL